MRMDTEVIVVGGGLNGLTAAALLAHHGVRCIVIERHAATSIQYKFAGISPRSMEIFRTLGLEDEIRAKRTGDQQGGGLGRARNLADPDLQWNDVTWPDASPFSPTQPATCDQHVLEPILEARAEVLGADVRFDTELVSFVRDSAAVRVRVRRRATGEEQTLQAHWLIAADGAGGTLREMLGVGRTGAGVLQHWMNIIFDTDMAPTLRGRRFTSCFVTDINGTFTPREGGRWLLALQYRPDAGERPEDFTAERCRELVRRGAGDPNVRADLVDARPWEAAAYVADRFQSGRCFIVGDAAHLMPPTGAFGGNSGIHDAHNLAWKLAYVLRRGAAPSLLESYDAERRPLIGATLDQSLARLKRWFKDLGGKIGETVDVVPDYDVVFGQRYSWGAFVPEAGAAEAPFAPHAALAGLPGTRAPHRVIPHGGKQVSTLDLFDRDLVLLATSGSAWQAAARPLEERGSLRGVALEDLAPFGVEKDGAVLVRPDGFVAWRSRGAVADPAAMLRGVCESLHFIPDETSGRHRKEMRA
jgi:2-polyprenyl-6-methoxyphenol hydroxylase-like FAD-dependent oxidoreductase